MTDRKVMRDLDNKVIAGVLSGIATYFHHDPLLFRVGYVLLTLGTGFVFGIVGYLILWAVLPVERVHSDTHTTYHYDQ